MTVFLCEKPSQASDIADVLGIESRQDGYIKTRQGLVTWAFGHLLELADPDQYNEAWKRWNKTDLPIIPETFSYIPKPKSSKQLNLIGRLLRSTNLVVIATDADREGEAIGRELLDHFDYQGDIKRLWLSALDPASIRKAMANIQPGESTESLYQAALARSRADWLHGINMTRAATLYLGNGSRQVLSAGRVQTPTLALVVTRDRLIDNFVPRQFYELDAVVTTTDGSLLLRHAPPVEPEDFRIYRKEAAQTLADACQGQSGILQVAKERKRQGPPKLFTLAGLQKSCNKLFSWPASKTLKIAQALYETHKVTTYPRSDCPYLPEEQQSDVSAILAHLNELDEFYNLVPGEPVIRKSVFNTAKVAKASHHAIIPTTQAADFGTFAKDEREAYLLICQHYLAALSPDHVYNQTSVSITINDTLFNATDKVTVDPGWKRLFRNQHKISSQLPAGLKDQTEGLMKQVDVVERTTTPPDHYTEGTLIDDMAKVAKYIDDPALKARLKETSGIGTEATRASIIETLKTRKFLKPDKKKILSTSAGQQLIDALPPVVSSIGETAVWEDALEAIAQGDKGLDEFIGGIEQQLRVLLESVSTMQPIQAGAQNTNFPCPDCGKDMRRLQNKSKGNYFWGCSGYPDCKTTLPDNKGKPGKSTPAPQADDRYPCPACKNPMVRRKSSKGFFWGCSSYPVCKQTLPDSKGKPGIAKSAQKSKAEHAGGSCPDCEGGQLIKREIKKGKNIGKSFMGCSNFPKCNHFSWK